MVQRLIFGVTIWYDCEIIQSFDPQAEMDTNPIRHTRVYTQSKKKDFRNLRKSDACIPSSCIENDSQSFSTSGLYLDQIPLIPQFGKMDSYPKEVTGGVSSLL